MIDVTVRGAGVFGLSVAFACARAGARVRVIDPGGVASGASGGPVGALAPHVPENWNPKKAFQLESLLMAERWWGEVEQLSDLPTGYARTGRLQAIPDAAALTRARARAGGAGELWADAAIWEVVASPDWAPVSESGFVIHDTLSARIDPLSSTRALAKAVEALGGEIMREGADTGAVVLATGVEGLKAMSAEVGQPVGGAVKGQAASLQLDRREQPQIFADGVHVVPHWDGTTAIGSTSERDVETCSTDAGLDLLIAKARDLVPALRDAEVIRRWAGLRPRAKSRAPMLGRYPGRAGVFVANGGFKIGFGMAPKVGETMAALILDGRDEIPEGFDVAASL